MFDKLKGFGLESMATAMGINEGNAFAKLGPLLAPIARSVSEPKVAAWLQVINEKNLHPGESHCGFITFEKDGKVHSQLCAFNDEGFPTRKLGHSLEMPEFIMGLLNANFDIGKKPAQVVTLNTETGKETISETQQPINDDTIETNAE